MKALLFAGLTVLTASCGMQDSASDLKNSPGTKVDDHLAAKVIGRYAIRSNMATIQNLPFVGKKPALASAYILVEIERKDEGLVARERHCHMKITSDNGLVNQIIPDALPQSMLELESPFRIWQDGALIRVAKDPVPQVVGAKLSNPNDALPTQVTDPRVFDQDGDGHPGVTVKVTGRLVNGEIYLVQRVKTSWSGTVDEKGLVSALLQDASDQTILDASSSLLKSTPEITPDPDASKTNVSFVQLPKAETYDCQRLIQEIPSLWSAQ